MKNKKDIQEILGALNDIDKRMGEFNDKANTMKSTINNNLNFRDLSKSIEQLNNLSKQTQNITPDIEEDSDTDEPYEYYISDTLKDIWDIVEATPNNMELGKKIRQLYFDNREATPDSMERVANEMKSIFPPTQMEIDFSDTEQMDLFDDPATKDRKRWGG